MAAICSSKCQTLKSAVTSAVATPSNTQPITSSIAAVLIAIAPMAVRSSFISSRILPMIGNAEMESATQKKS